MRLAAGFVAPTMSDAEPAFGDDIGTEAERALEGHLEFADSLAHDGEEVRVRPADELDVQAELHGPRHVHVLRHRKNEARDAVGHPEPHRGARTERRRPELARSETELRPARSPQRPGALLSHGMHLVAPRPDLQSHSGCFAHAVVLALEEAVEEASLKRQRLRRVVGGPLAAAVRVEEAVLGADPAESLEAAA